MIFRGSLGPMQTTVLADCPDWTMSDDGTSFTAIGDRGVFVTGQIIRDANGDISGITSTEVKPLLPPLGSKTPDSEGIAIGASGDIYVSVEAKHRVLAFDSLDATSARIATPS